MNLPFKHWSLKGKFTGLTMFISLLGLSLFSGAYALNEYFTARTDMQRELTLLAEAAAAEAVGPIAFDDEAQISRLVRQFHDNPAVLAVRLYKADGTVAGEWKRATAMEHEWPARDLQDAPIYGWEMAYITRGVRLPTGPSLGTLCICSDLKPVKDRMRQTLAALLGLWGICLGVAYFATRYLQGLVVGPITDLARTMHQVTETRNYTQRVAVTSGDEIGRLEASFNDLLGKLQVSQGELEHRVRERTSELGEMNERLVQEVQKRFRTEEALRQSEQRVNQAVQGSEIGLWEWEPSTQAAYFSKEWKAHLGYADHELTDSAETWSRLLHPQDKDRSWQLVNDFIAGRVAKYEVEFRLQHKDGSWRWILSRAQMFSDPQSGLLRLVGTQMDITPRKEAERIVSERTVQLAQANAALQRSEEQMGLAVKGSDLGLWNWNIVTNHVTFSERLLGMIGYTVAEVKPHVSSWEELLHPDDKPHVMAVLTEHLEGRTPVYETEHRLKVKGGGWLWVLNRGQVVERDAKGNPLRAAGTHLDISLRKEAEHLQHDSHARKRREDEAQLLLLAHTLESTREMIAIADPQNRFIYANEAFQSGYGYSMSELIGQPSSLVGPVLPESLLAEIPRQTIAGGWRGELLNRAKDGREFPISLSTSPVFNPAGELVAMVGVATEISDRKRLEREVLEAAERERQRIGQDLHDDLCQHLTGIRFKAALVEKKLGADRERLRDDVAEIIRQLANATDLARAIARGLQPVDPAPGGLMTALQHLVTNTERTFRLSCHCRFPKPVLLHDPTTATHLYRIAQEAVQNAIKHGRAERIELLLEVQGDRLALTVTDDGHGIQSSLSGGIGLPTMRHRAQLLGGVLEVAPLQGGGTQVVCSLPHYPPPPPPTRGDKETGETD